MYSEFGKGELFRIDLFIQQRQIYKAVNIDTVILTNSSLILTDIPLFTVISCEQLDMR